MGKVFQAKEIKRAQRVDLGKGKNLAGLYKTLTGELRNRIGKVFCRYIIEGCEFYER